MSPSIHALALALLILSSLVLCIAKGEAPKSLGDFARSTGRAALTMVGVLVVLYLGVPACKCGPGNNPRMQIAVTLLAAALVAFAVQQPRLRRIYIVLALAVGTGLSFHFKSLVLSPAACQYTGDPAYIENSCRQPAVAEKLWHTRLTGIYAVIVKKV